MSRENIETVRRAYDAWNRGEPEAAIELLSPEIEWHLPPNLPDAESWRGRDEVVQGLSSLSGSWSELRAEVRDLISAGDRVVALVRFQGQGATTGLPVEGVSVDAQVWTLREGRVVEVRMYSGTDEALEAVGLQESD